MAFVPYMVGGFAVDKLMGGDGTKGALLGAGGSFLPSMLASGAAAGATPLAGVGAEAAAASTFPSLLTTAGGAGQAVGTAELAGLAANAPARFGTGALSGNISAFTPAGTTYGVAGNTGVFGQEIANQTFDSALNPRFLGGALDNSLLGDGLDYVGKGKDFIDEGWKDMSTSDKMGSVSMANQAVEAQTQPQNIIAPPPPPMERRNPNPTPNAPLVTQVQGLQQMAPQQMMGQLNPEDQMKYYSLLNSGQ